MIFLKIAIAAIAFPLALILGAMCGVIFFTAVWIDMVWKKVIWDD